MVDDVSVSEYRAAVSLLLSRSFAAWSKMPPEVWAEEIRRMAGGARFRFSYAPYLLKMYLSFFDPVVQETILELFSRAGKSEIVLNAIGYSIDQSPRRILCLWPTNSNGEKWSKDNLTGELLDQTPCLSYLGSKASKRTGNNTLMHKSYPGGLIDIFGGNAPGDMRRAKGDFLYAEEIDAIQTSETDEGDQLDIFWKRGDEYPDTIRISCSYPSLKGKSRIHKKIEDSDFQKWFVTCVLCGGEPFVMHRKEHLRYEKNKPHEARMECPRCHNLLTDSQRYAMMMGGDPAHPRYDLWQPTQEFRGKRGFQANSMLWPHPVDLQKFPGGYLQKLAEREIAIEQADNPDRSRRVMVNTEDAEPYQPEYAQKVAHTDLYNRREEYDPRKEIPQGVMLVTLGADLQSDRAEMEFVGHGINVEEYKASGNIVYQSWGLGYRVARGSPLRPELWEKLENILTRVSFKHPCGQYLHVACGLMDSRYKPDEVYKFMRRMTRLRVFGCEGSVVLGRPIIGRKPQKRGNPPVLVWEIGTHEAKDVLYQRMEITDPDAYGYMHFPATADYNEPYFKGLTIEESTMERGGDGNFFRFFQKVSNDDRNEPLDCRVYATAAERILRPNYAKLAERFELQITAEKQEQKPVQRPQKPVRRGLVSTWRR